MNAVERGWLRRSHLRSSAFLCGLGVLLAAGCTRRDDGTVTLGTDQPASQESVADMPPVAINPVPPMVYPPALLEQGIEGRVLLRLYVDAQGKLVTDSTRVAESSGYPAFDSAAVRGATSLRFSPALRHGRPVSAPFLQPVHFRNPRNRSAP
jgi:TonB family protein